MSVAGSLQLSYDLGLCKNLKHHKRFKSTLGRGRLPLLSTALSSRTSLQKHDSWSVHLSESLRSRILSIPYRSNGLKCHSFLSPDQAFQVPVMKAASVALTRSYSALQGSPLTLKLASGVGLMVFAVWGLGPLMRLSRNLLLNNDQQKNESSWKKSGMYHVTTSYIQPLLLWIGAILICRVIDPVVLPTETSQAVKRRLLNFVRSLSTVLAFAYCLSGVIQEAQKYFMETSETSDAQKMGFQFAGKAFSSAVWVAAVSLFMELLGFSTQRWLTAGGLGTVLLTLAGREIFTNFLSSAMIHATRPFVLNEWIQTKIEGYDVSGTVEHVGWWSPTIIRGEDREAVHIPNHKFTVNIVRNLTQKTHWRIKTHLAISHLDVSKINNIVADMRKVLAKNPHVEQQRLHRRVFLENVNPENQALLILVSCFVKTSHFEEYLCVKEAVLMDLLRVIRHHRARLATPIRTVQKLYSDSDLDNVPFADSFYNGGGVASNRPLLLIEPSYKINGEDKTKSQTRSSRPSGEQDAKTSRSTADSRGGASPKVNSKAKETSKAETKAADTNNGEKQGSEVREPLKASTILASDSRVADNVIMKSSQNSKPKTNSSAADASSSDSKAVETITKNLTGKVSDSKQPKRVSSGNVKQNSSKVENPLVSSSEAETEKAGGLQESPQSMQVERKSVPQSSVAKPVLEENLVLGVALQGSKRTLPIEEDMNSPTEQEVKEMATAHRDETGNPGAEKDKVDAPVPPTSSASER